MWTKRIKRKGKRAEIDNDPVRCNRGRKAKALNDNHNPTRPTLSLVIPVHDNLELTKTCLESLTRQQVDFSFEVVIVDDGSTQSTAEWLRQESGAHIVRNNNCQGFPKAVNAGLAATHGDLLMILNNDTILPAETLQRMVQAYRSHPRIGVIGPSCDRIKGGQQITTPDLNNDPQAVENFGRQLGYQYDGKIEDVLYVMGVAMLFPRKVLETVGNFDERFGAGNFEDDDFCFRVKEQGLRIVVARDTFVHHIGGSTFTGRNIDYKKLLEKNRDIYLDKWRDHPVMGAFVHQRQGDLPRAIFNCHEALKRQTNNHEVLRFLGEMLYEQQKPREALQFFDQLLSLAPRYTSAAIIKTSIHLELDEEDAARQAMAKLLLEYYLNDKSAAHMLTFFAQSCIIWGKIDEAQGHLDLALELDPECEPALNTRKQLNDGLQLACPTR